MWAVGRACLLLPWPAWWGTVGWWWGWTSQRACCGRRTGPWRGRETWSCCMGMQKIWVRLSGPMGSLTRHSSTQPFSCFHSRQPRCGRRLRYWHRGVLWGWNNLLGLEDAAGADLYPALEEKAGVPLRRPQLGGVEELERGGGDVPGANAPLEEAAVRESLFPVDWE